MNLRPVHVVLVALLSSAVAAEGGGKADDVNVPADGQGAPFSRAGFGEAWEAVDCKTFGVPDSVAAQSDCGYVSVPELHAQPRDAPSSWLSYAPAAPARRPLLIHCSSNRAALGTPASAYSSI